MFLMKSISLEWNQMNHSNILLTDSFIFAMNFRMRDEDVDWKIFDENVCFLLRIYLLCITREAKVRLQESKLLAWFMRSYL